MGSEILKTSLTSSTEFRGRRKHKEFHRQLCSCGQAASYSIAKNLRFPFSFQGAQISSKLSARACVKFKTVKSHVKYSCYWFQISLALHPPRTTERLVVYCIC